MDIRTKLEEYAEMHGWNKNKLIGWSEAADFGHWLLNNEVGFCPCCKRKTINTLEHGWFCPDIECRIK